MAKKSDPKEVKASKDAKASKKDAPKKKGGIKKYFRDLNSEIKKVVWPTKEKVVNNSGIVIGIMLVMGLVLAGIDFGCLKGIDALFRIGK